MSGYWSPEYWSEDYWADDYWASSGASGGQSTLYVERVVEVLKFTLTRKDGTGTDDFYVSHDYWDEGTLYTGNPEIYPVLAELVSTPRSVDRVMGVRHDVTLSLFAKSHLDGYQRGFLDLTATHELRGSAVQVRRYWRSKDGVVANTTDNIRQTLQITGYSVSGGLLRVEARDTWFEDKELSKRLTPTDFPNIQDEFAYEYGAIVFGQGASGVIVDAPYINADDETADLFCGWTFPNHPMNSFQAAYLQNPDTIVDSTPWLQVGFVNDPTTPWNGTNYDPTEQGGFEYGRHLSLYSRGKVISPSSQTRVLYSVVCDIYRPRGYWAAEFDGVNDVLYMIEPNGLSPRDEDFTVGFWVRFTSVGEQAIIAKGELGAGTGEWGVEMTATSTVRFWISTDGTNRSYTASTSALSAATWYHIFAGHDATNDQIFIRVNNGTATTAAAVGITVFEGNGPLQIGYMNGVTYYFYGRMCQLGYWKGVVGSTERSSIYNGGNGRAYESLTNGDKTALVAWWDLDEFYGHRSSSQGGKELSQAGDVGSDQGKVATTFTTSKGEVRVAVYHARFLSETGTWTTEGSALRSTAYDTEEIEGGTILGSSLTQFPMDPPLPLSPNVSYFLVLEFTNKRDHPYSVWCDYDGVVSESHYAKFNDDEGDGKGWELQTDVQLSMALYAIGNDGGFIDDTGSAPYYSHYTIQGYRPASGTSMTWPLLSKETQYKFAVYGLEDDGSGTYTGSANAIIRNASDVVRFVLMNADFGRGLTSGEVDTASLTAARTAAALNLSFAIDRRTYASELLRKICEQTGLILLKSRDGKLKLHWPTYHGGTFDYEVDEGRHRDQFAVLGYDDAPDREVYNDFVINFGVDPLNLPKSQDFIFRAGSNSFAATLYANGTESNISDSNRVSRLAESQATYGPREYRRDFDLFASNSTTALTGVLRRLIDRWSVKPRRATIRVPLKDYYAVDLFDTFRIRHTALPAEGGTAKRLLWHVDGEQVIQYQDGVPTTSMGMGAIEGEVIGISEFDQSMEITIETVVPFSSS